MKKKLKFVIVGCGRISKKHVELFQKKRIKNAILIGVCDSKIEKAKIYNKLYKIPYFKNSSEMIKLTNPDVIVILTESGNHARDVIKLSKFKKHIIVEKPMALKIKDAQLMIKECKKNKIKLFIVKQNRFNLPVIQLKKALEKNRFKKITLATVRVRWSRRQEYYDNDDWRGTHKMDGGVLSNQASHHVDLIDWLMDGIKSVNAFSKTSLAKIETGRYCGSL
jgi:Predicted dehydrogenases and related proteins